MERRLVAIAVFATVGLVLWVALAMWWFHAHPPPLG